MCGDQFSANGHNFRRILALAEHNRIGAP